MENINLSVKLDDQEALDLAQFLKRVGFSEFKTNAVDENEAYRMRDVCEKVRKALSEIGFSPR